MASISIESENGEEKRVAKERRIRQYSIHINGTVVQLVRAPPCHGGSCGFESRQSRFKNLKDKPTKNKLFLVRKIKHVYIY